MFSFGARVESLFFITSESSNGFGFISKTGSLGVS
jgi:hypothetical protein